MWPLFLIRSRLLSNRRRLGVWGEKYAQKYMMGRGYTTLALNFSTPAGELDLVMISPEKTIVFCEVKTRAHEDIARAIDAVKRPKQKRIAAAAHAFVKKYGLGVRPLRFDVITIILPRTGQPQLRHYENAFVPTK